MATTEPFYSSYCDECQKELAHMGPPCEKARNGVHVATAAERQARRDADPARWNSLGELSGRVGPRSNTGIWPDGQAPGDNHD